VTAANLNQSTVADPRPVLELRGINKHFSGVQALTDVNLCLMPGEVHTLMGQNGAGKSTLIKVLTGVHVPDAGTILLDGKAVQPRSTLEAQRLGISTVYQEVNLCGNLSVAENIFIGRYPRRFGVIDRRAMAQRASALLRKLKLDIDVARPLSSYSLAVQQMVAIARALDISARILILDEPTSSLDEAEVNLLFDTMRELRAQGMAILFVTHFLDQTYAISDRITVMRNGQREGEYLCDALQRLDLVNKMLGRQAGVSPSAGEDRADTNAEPADGHKVFLRARGLGRRGAVEPLDLEIRGGETLGFCGLLGAGRSETARLLFAADKADSGTIEIDGKLARIDTPRAAIAAGIGYCSEDRKHEGAILSLSLRENIVLALQARMGAMRAIPYRRQRELAERYVALLGIKAAHIDLPIGALSGGNQQKALLARWMAVEPRMLILDEPTRGVDVHAKMEIMDCIDTLRRDGMAVVFISSELPEVLRCADRLLVMREHRACGTYRRGELDEHSVLEAISANATPGHAP
jgi:simple sugar transport system ATP-binding protein